MKNSIDKLKSAIEKINLTLARKGLTAPPPGMIFETQPYNKKGACCYIHDTLGKQCIGVTQEVCMRPKGNGGLYEGDFRAGQTCDTVSGGKCPRPAGGVNASTDMVSAENKIHNFSKALKAPPIPTLLRRPEKVDKSLMVGGGGGGGNGSYSICGVEIQNDDNETIFMVYTAIIKDMYCREALVAGCYSVFVGQPFDGSITGEGQVTDRDLPLTWQRTHPEFDPADPGTWGSVFGIGGLAERYVRFLNCDEADGGMDGNGPCSNGYDVAKIARLVEIVRQLYIAKCGFAVSSAGACCTASEFGGFTCAEGLGTECLGTFYPGQSCEAIGNDNCGLQQNPIQQNPNEQKTRNRDEQKKAAGELIKQLKLFTRR